MRHEKRLFEHVGRHSTAGRDNGLLLNNRDRTKFDGNSHKAGREDASRTEHGPALRVQRFHGSGERDRFPDTGPQGCIAHTPQAMDRHPDG